MTGRLKRTEAGSGGKRGHSSMSHWNKTVWVKYRARKVRRANDKALRGDR